MKISENTKEIETSLNNSKSFNIKASPKAFKILSSNLYSNKIRAIIRELSCNAYDAHMMANNNEPFIVHLPNDIDEHFYVKDFGIGLSEEDVMNLYTTYFDSNKTDSNEFIGALGLGSKSPFSYTDSFIVESRFNGYKTTYLVYINENEIPSISKIESIESDEHSGLTVKFSINKEDIYKFTNEAINVLTVFEKQPKITGGYTNIELNKTFQFNNKNYIIDNGFIHQRYSNDNIFAFMGNILYPIELNRLELDDNIVNFIYRHTLVIKFNIGELDITPSREHLSYIKTTIDTLQSRINKTFDDIIEDSVEIINNSSTLLEMIDKFDNMSDDLRPLIYNKIDRTKFKFHDIIFNDKNNKFRSKSIDSLNNQNLCIDGIEYIKFRDVDIRSKSREPYLRSSDRSLLIASRNNIIYISFNNKQDKLFKTNTLFQNVLLTVKKNKYCRLSEDEIIDKLQDIFYGTTFQKCSELKEKEIEHVDYIKYSNDMAVCHNIKTLSNMLTNLKISFNNMYFDSVNVIENDGKTFYIPVINKHIFTNHEDIMFYKTCINMFTKYKMNRDIKIIFCRNKAINYIQNEYKLPNFLTFMVRCLRRNKKVFNDIKFFHDNISDIDNIIRRVSSSLSIEEIKYIKDEKLKLAFQKYYRNRDNDEKFDNLSEQDIKKIYGRNILKKKNNIVLENYRGFLGLISNTWMLKTHTETIINMLNLIYENTMKGKENV